MATGCPACIFIHFGRARNCAGSRPTTTPARTFIYCAEALTYAFPDARIMQVVRDGRDAVAGW